MGKPTLSTIVLNWNRAPLLTRTLESYARTVSCPQELWIVDNHSSDGSREVIEAFVAQHPDTHVIYLPENRGGEGANEALAKISGEFVYLCENDQLHQPGWCEHALDMFSTFPRLGQLSLHGPVPTDDEAWISKPVSPRVKQGRLLYHPYGNVGTSSILRGSLFKNGLRLHNRPLGEDAPKFPDDIRLSQEVREKGYWPAFSEHYYVRNLGHETAEMERDDAYYRANYQAKPVGLQGLRQRVTLQQQLQHVQRRSLILPEEKTSGDLAPPSRGLDARFWSMFDMLSPEVECVDLIHSLVRAHKPQRVLQTSGWRGQVTIAVARALAANGLGIVTTLEGDAETNAALSEVLAENGLQNVQLRQERSERFASRQRFDCVVFDGAPTDAEEEFFHILPMLEDGALIIFTRYREEYPTPDNLPARLEALGILKGHYLAAPRGFYAGTYRPHPSPGPGRVMLCLSAGRSGTGFLSNLLQGLPGLIALHEPEPKYQWQTLALQKRPQHAHDFLEEHKLPWIRQLPAASYLETSHYVQNGFMEAWLENDVVPDAIILHRDARQIALSWYALGMDFHSGREGVRQHMLHPEDARRLLLPLGVWEDLHAYQLCYWYALESSRRMEHYRQLLAARGAQLFDTSLEKLSAGKDIEPLLTWLGVEATPEILRILARRARQAINRKQRYKDPARLESLKSLDLDTLEREVYAHIKKGPLG